MPEPCRPGPCKAARLADMSAPRRTKKKKQNPSNILHQSQPGRRSQVSSGIGVPAPCAHRLNKNAVQWVLFFLIRFRAWCIQHSPRRRLTPKPDQPALGGGVPQKAPSPTRPHDASRQSARCCPNLSRLPLPLLLPAHGGGPNIEPPPARCDLSLSGLRPSPSGKARILLGLTINGFLAPQGLAIAPLLHPGLGPSNRLAACFEASRYTRAADRPCEAVTPRAGVAERRNKRLRGGYRPLLWPVTAR